MRRFNLAGIGIAFLTSVGSAGAADFPVKAPPPPVCPYCDWGGFYVGANLGGSLGSVSRYDAMSILNVPPAGMPLANPIQSFGDRGLAAGILGGAQIGWNWQFSRNWMFGVEADWQATGQTSNSYNTAEIARSGIKQVSNTLADQEKIPWLATARARAGWVENCWLWYVTGGVAWSKVDSTMSISTQPASATLESIPGGFASASFSNTRVGFTIGGGVETSLGQLGPWANNWSAKLEYLYVNLGSTNGSLLAPYNVAPLADLLQSNTHISDNIVRVGVNYKFGGAPSAVWRY
jgi:outer membrane immunogenic protein